eukprot:1749912-Pleurochrysis_carterae.AAC.1
MGVYSPGAGRGRFECSSIAPLAQNRPNTASAAQTYRSLRHSSHLEKTRACCPCEVLTLPNRSAG